MAGLVPAIHVFLERGKQDVDARHKAGHDGTEHIDLRLDIIAMYLPDHFRVEDVPQMHALMRGRPFAALISSGASGLYATHLPTVLKDEGAFGTVECHLARGNPHWKELADGNEALMIFQGPESYITPNWYPTK